MQTCSSVVCSMLWFLAGSALAADIGPLPRTRVEDSPAFDSVLEAVLAGYGSVTRPFPHVEVGGAIVKKEAKFFYTAPVTTDQTMALGFRVALQRGETIVAWYHTHPAAPEWDPYQKNEMEYFSKGDVAIAKRLGVPAYLTSEPAGDVLVFDPQLDRRRITSTGRAVGRRVAILPISLHSAWLAK